MLSTLKYSKAKFDELNQKFSQLNKKVAIDISSMKTNILNEVQLKKREEDEINLGDFMVSGSDIKKLNDADNRLRQMILNVGNEIGKVKIEQKQYNLTQKNVAKSIQRLLAFMYKSEPIHHPAPPEKKKPKTSLHDNVININVG